jgi:hypothetical protein
LDSIGIDFYDFLGFHPKNPKKSIPMES